MERLHNPELVNNAKLLRKNQTKEERKLWHCFLRSLPVKFYRQKILVNYIVDFYCAEKKLVIELDGSQHYEDEGKRKDIMRDTVLHDLGLTVLRYSNLQIDREFQNVCKDILLHLGLQ